MKWNINPKSVIRKQSGDRKAYERDESNISDREKEFRKAFAKQAAKMKRMRAAKLIPEKK